MDTKSPSPSKGSLLIVDDDPSTLRLMRAVLLHDGWQVTCANTKGEATAAWSTSRPDAVIVDVYLDKENGLDLIREWRSLDSAVGMVVVSSDDSATLAAHAMEIGADNFLSKPVSPAALLLAATKAAELSRQRGQIQSLQAQLNEREASPHSRHGMVTHSDLMASVLRLIDRVGPTDISVLISGESGTGKELVARAIHQSSPRARKPFIELNCAALPPNLVESELFGHERGAFTGAIAGRQGVIEQAHGGTLFLDEVGELPLEVQPKLLRSLQERRITRVGGTALLDCDFRLVAATNRILSDEVRAGRFREDLYFRLAVFPLQLPPLRQRPEDIALLLSHFLSHYGAGEIQVTPQAITLIQNYPWPGNVRELQNFAQAAAILSVDGVLDVDQVRAYLGHRLSVMPETQESRPVRNLADLERQEILYAMEHHQGNVAEAARALGMGRATLYKYLARQGLPKSEGP